MSKEMINFSELTNDELKIYLKESGFDYKLEIRDLVLLNFKAVSEQIEKKAFAKRVHDRYRGHHAPKVVVSVIKDWVSMGYIVEENEKFRFASIEDLQIRDAKILASRENTPQNTITY